MSEQEFVFAAKTAELPEGGKLLLEIDDRLVVLVHVEGQFFAIDDVCTHDGGPLSEGELCNHSIACPRHGARFDLRTGAALTMPATQPTVAHDVKVEGDNIYIRVHSQ